MRVGILIEWSRKRWAWNTDMSWMQKLYETYEQCAASTNLQDAALLVPPFHVIQQAHLEVVLDGNGTFRRARVIKKEETVIPATKRSATARTSAIVPHPLCDHLKYCAADYRNKGERNNRYFEAYHAQLKRWCTSSYSHPKAIAILRYVEKAMVIQDLIREKVLPVDSAGRLLTRWESRDDKPPLFNQLTKDKKTREYKPQNALIRWVVECDRVPEVWKDPTIADAWINFCAANETRFGLCMVTGSSRALADKHPKGLRGGKDGAKLISHKKESESGFIYLGRFLKVDQVVGVGLDVTQKAHSALRWLIARQGFENGNQIAVAWVVSGKSLPDPFANSAQIFDLESAQEDTTKKYEGDAGQAFAVRLRKYIAGYQAQLGSTDEVVVMAIDSATPGRMAITYYRELTGSEFLERVRAWHESCAWHQNFSKDLKFVGAPSPNDISEAAYGRQLEGKSGKRLRKATVERMLPCIIDGRPIPRDLVESVVRRTSNRATFKEKQWEWEKNLGIACALYRAQHRKRSYQMALEQDRKSRDYLFGRLLAVAEHLEGRALHLADEQRATSAARLMQRFADRPNSTWRTIELSLGPYKARLRSGRTAFLSRMEKLIDEITCAFASEDYISDASLSGEFLLGYHCQRQDLWRKPESADAEEIIKESNQGE